MYGMVLLDPRGARAQNHEYAHLSSSGSPERELVGVFDQPKPKRVCSLQTFGGKWIALPLCL